MMWSSMLKVADGGMEILHSLLSQSDRVVFVIFKISGGIVTGCKLDYTVLQKSAWIWEVTTCSMALEREGETEDGVEDCKDKGVKGGFFKETDEDDCYFLKHLSNLLLISR